MGGILIRNLTPLDRLTRGFTIIAMNRRPKSGVGGALPGKGMTLVEMIITIILVTVGLFILSGWMSSMRQAARRDLAVRLLSDLDKALSRYCRASGQYPQGAGPNAANWATTALLDLDRTRPLLEALPDSLWAGPGRKNLVDPWGTPLLYLADPRESPLVRANNGRPVFISAGPDREFGEDDAARIGDNLRSDDPGPEGFRLHDLIRESSTTREAETHGQKDD